ncbi:MAG: hypothetical protein ACXADX_13315 [Candidatus Hodarchaeales archaeon]
MKQQVKWQCVEWGQLDLSGQYDQWFVMQLKQLLDALTGQGELESAQKEVERGIQHGEANPGQISSILLAMGRTAVDALGALEAPETPVAAPALDFSELSEAIVSRKKGRVEKKLRGSLDDLKDV